MGRLFFCGLFVIAIACLFAYGCQTPEERLGIKYAAPEIPKKLEQYFAPAPNQKAFELLREGETQIDMHAYYRSLHRMGWDNAVAEIDRDWPRQFKTLDDVYGGLSAMGTGCEAYWNGYNSAYTQYGDARPN